MSGFQYNLTTKSVILNNPLNLSFLSLIWNVSSEQNFQLVLLSPELSNMNGLAQQHFFFFGNGSEGRGNSGLGYPRKEDLIAIEHLTAKHGHR